MNRNTFEQRQIFQRQATGDGDFEAHIGKTFDRGNVRFAPRYACGLRVTAVTIEDALKGGCTLFDIEQLKRENSADDFKNLFMCEFVDDKASVFPFEELQRCMVDTLEEWEDYAPFAANPFGSRPVWIGYDPSHRGDSAGCVVLAPPVVAGGKFRILERHQWKGMDFATQAESIRKLTEKYNVEYIGIDATGLGVGVFQLVRSFYPAARDIRYTPEMKTAMVLKAKDVIRRGCLEYDVSATDITSSFMAIRKTMTSSGRSAIGYWEPMALTDVTRSPGCMVNLGFSLPAFGKTAQGTAKKDEKQVNGAFYHVHWYKYPLTYWLNIITSLGCLEGGDLDIAYLSEIDPTWTDSSLTTILNPEAVIFANPIAQGACAADAIASAFNMPLDVLFWCAGSQGSMYPFNGWVSNESSPLQSSLLVSERMAFKLHRQGMIMETIGKNNAVCNEYPSPILPKERWRYQMVNMYPDSGQCHPFGRSVMRWETGKNPPNTKKNFGYLMWRKRNCVFL